MASLEELMGTQTIPLTDLVDTQVGTNDPLPASVTRNRASITALQTDKPVENYQAYTADGAVGSSASFDKANADIAAANKESDFVGMMNILSSPDAPIEEKQSALEAYNTSSFLTSPEVSLATSALTAESKGMNKEQDAVRVSTADSLGEYFQNKAEYQSIVSAFEADNNTRKGAARSWEWIREFTPGAEAISSAGFQRGAAEVTGENRSWVQTLKDLTLTGFSTKEFREKFDNMDDATRLSMINSYLSVIKENDGIIFGDSQVASINMLNRYVKGEYSTSEAVFDSFLNVLDIVGIGTALKGGARALRAGRTAGRAAQAAQDAAETADIAQGIRRSGSTTDPLAGRSATAATEVPSRPSVQPRERLDPGSVQSLQEEIDTISTQLKGMTDVSIRRAADESGMSGDARKQFIADQKAAMEAERTNLQNRQASIRSRLAIDSATPPAPTPRSQVSLPTLNPIMDSISRVELNRVVAPYNPSAAANILGTFNPAQGRVAFKALYSSVGDDLALAGYGVNKQDAIVSQVFPQVGTEGNRITAKVVDVQRELAQDLPLDEGGLRFTASEQDNMAAQVLNDFRNVRGLTPHDAESTFRVTVDGGYLDVKAMYGTTEGGFQYAEDALEQAKYALREQGVLDKDITIMQRQGVDYVPVDLASVKGIAGDFKVQVTKQIEQRFDMLGDGWEAFDVKKNFFDRFSPLMFEGAGSVNRMVTDAATNLHPAISGSFANAVDLGTRLDKLLLKQADAFAKTYNKFPKARKAKMWDYLLEANRDGLKNNYTDLKARGFSDAEIDNLEDFRSFWDTHWQLENLDRVRTYRAEGQMLMETSQGDRYFAKPSAKNINEAQGVLDPSIDGVRDFTRAELDDLYATNGTIAKLKEPIEIDGKVVTHMVSRNTPEEYLRALDDSDKILNYRDGYFQISYKAPRFIREKLPNGDWKAVAVAGDIQSAEREVKRLTAQTGKEYMQTGDNRAFRQSGDAYWQTNSASGRIAQRRRGQLLEGAMGLNHIGTEFIENPIDSAIRAARSISGRTVSRPAIETAKARAMAQYGKFLPKDEFGQAKYPTDVKSISFVGEYTTKDLADARTTFENIHRFENGYINTIDEASKAVFNWAADTLGSIPMPFAPTLERGARAVASGSAAGLVKATAFQAYIALNPIRNWIMQPVQVMRTFAYNPIDWVNGAIPGYLSAAAKYKMGGKLSSSEMKFIKSLQDTGLLDGVDRSSLVRGAMLEAADTSNRITKGISRITEYSRKIGFDVGEKINLLGHYAAVYAKYERQGADLTSKRVLAEIQSEARAISGEMNKAGDLAYTQNILSVPLQFAQVPHKFFLGATNRRIPLGARIRMAGADAVMWGVPGVYALNSAFGDSVLPDDPELRDMVVSGVTASTINWTFQQIAGDDTNIDFSSLNPYNMDGMSDVVGRIMSEGLGAVITGSPAGQLLLKDSGRVGQAFGSLFRYLSPSDEGIQTEEGILDVINNFAKITSVWNNGTKAYMAYATKMYIDKMGLPIDKNVTTTEALAMAFGFAPKEVGQFYETRERLFDNQKAAEEAAKEIGDTIIQVASSTSDDPLYTSPETISKRSAAMTYLTQQDPRMGRLVGEYIKSRLRDPEMGLARQLIKASGMPNAGDLPAVIKSGPFSDADKEASLKYLKDFDTTINNMKGK